MLAVPYEQPATALAFPPEWGLFAAQWIHAVVRMDAGKQMLDVILQQTFCITPAVSVNVGGHGAVDPMSESLRIPLRLAVIAQKDVEVRKFRHVEIGSGQFDITADYRLLKSFFFLPL